MINNYINQLLGLKDVNVKKVVQKSNSVEIHILTKPSAQVCPCCGNSTSRIHDYRSQKIKDLPFQLKNCFLILNKRRYVCSCGKKFYEHYDFLAKYQHQTKRLGFKVISMLRENVSMSYVAKSCNISINTVARLFDTVHYEKPRVPKVLSIDEFKGNAETGKYQCILVNPVKNRVLDILPDRTQGHLIDYFASIPKQERLRVEFFVCDMWQPYAELAKIYFPNAQLVTDKYHFYRQITWAIDRIRKRLQKTMLPSLRKYYKRSRKLIHAPFNSLSKEDQKACTIMLLYNEELRRAHALKEWFYEIVNEKSYAKQRSEFKDWISDAATCGIKDMADVAATYSRWSKGILNAFKYGYTNGPTEGFNNKIKVLKRISFGIRNFERFRNRILHCTN